MKIILDNIIFALQRSGGISVVWYELISRILRNRNEDDIQCLNYRNTNIFYETLKNKGLIKESFINLKILLNDINHSHLESINLISFFTLLIIDILLILMR